MENQLSQFFCADNMTFLEDNCVTWGKIVSLNISDGIWEKKAA